MRQTLLFILPVLFPSWRFFKTVEPAPRVEWSLFGQDAWRPLSPTPARISPLHLLRTLIWNPHRNEDLFMISCAERIAIAPTPHSIHEIAQRIAPLVKEHAAFQFRLVFIHRYQDRLCDEVVFVSDVIT